MSTLLWQLLHWLTSVFKNTELGQKPFRNRLHAAVLQVSMLLSYSSNAIVFGTFNMWPVWPAARIVPLSWQLHACRCESILQI